MTNAACQCSPEIFICDLNRRFLNSAMHLIFPQNQLGQLSDNSGYLFGETSLVRPQSLKHLTLTKAGSRNPVSQTVE